MKNSRKREVALIASSIVLGVAITGPAAQAAEMLTAQRSTQKIYVDGQRVQLEAYSISGNNYAKLSDIGKAVGFSVTYDPLTNTVRINTTEPYADEAPAQSLHTVTPPRTAASMSRGSATTFSAMMAQTTPSPTSAGGR